MLRKEITYTDYDGNKRTEEFYFNLSQAEVAEMEVMTPGGFSKKLTKIAESKDAGQIIEVFKNILLLSYGEKSDDGRRFVKSPELSKAFSETEAYNQLFMELATNGDLAAAFVNSILPEKIIAKLPSS